MIIMKNKLKIAVVQAAPIMFDKEKMQRESDSYYQRVR